jgi:hypothetical protein
VNGRGPLDRLAMPEASVRPTAIGCGCLPSRANSRMIPLHVRSVVTTTSSFPLRGTAGALRGGVKGAGDATERAASTSPREGST